MPIKFFDKESSVTTSSVYLAYLILKRIEKNKDKSNRISIFKLIKLFKAKNNVFHPNQFFYSLMFLYVTGIIDLEEPFLVLNHA